MGEEVQRLPCVDTVTYEAAAGTLNAQDRRALLDALDAVPRGHYEDASLVARHEQSGRIDAEARAERAEAEARRWQGRAHRYAHRADDAEGDNERLREALTRIEAGPGPGEGIGWEWGAEQARAALSADEEPEAGERR